MIVEIVLILVIVVLFISTIIPPNEINFSFKMLSAVRKLPGPHGLPFIGMGLFVATVPDKELMNVLVFFLNKYPRILATYIIGFPVVAIQDSEDLEVIMGSTHHITKGCEYNLLQEWLREGLLLSTGAKWHQRRKLLTPAFHFRILEDNLQSLNKHSRYLVRNMLENNGKPFILTQLVSLCTLDIICETAMGFSLDFQDNKAANYVAAIKRLSKLMVTRVLKFWLRREWIMKLFGYQKQYTEDLALLHSFTEKIIKERKISYMNKKTEDLEKTDLKGEPFMAKKRKAFLDILIELSIQHPNLLTDIDIREEVDTFMFEGHDTTSAAVSFALYLLGCYPEIQDKVFEEQLNIFGESDRVANSKDLCEMHYLEMVIKETLRLYPSVPYLSRIIKEEVKLAGDLIIPCGINVVIVPYSIHRNPKVFPDPEVFNPERFTIENSKNRHPYAYIPFSAGPRNCIGQKFAMMELKVVISTVIRKLKLEAVTKREDLTLLPFIIIKTEPNIEIIARPRSTREC